MSYDTCLFRLTSLSIIISWSTCVAANGIFILPHFKHFFPRCFPGKDFIVQKSIWRKTNAPKANSLNGSFAKSSICHVTTLARIDSKGCGGFFQILFLSQIHCICLLLTFTSQLLPSAPPVMSSFLLAARTDGKSKESCARHFSSNRLIRQVKVSIPK